MTAPVETGATSPADRPQLWPLTPPQQALWFLENFNPGSSFYVIGLGLVLRGPLATDAMRTAVIDTITRHESLRSRFLTVAGRPYQTFRPTADVQLELTDLSHEPDPERAARAYLEEMSAAPFDLGAEPPVRLRLVRLSHNRHALLLAVHHIVFDGWSTQVLLSDLAACYAARRAGREPQLAPPEIGIGEYAADLAGTLGRGLADDELEYWRDALHAAPVLDLPTDRPRPTMRSFAGAANTLSLDAATSASVRELARRTDTTVFTVLATAFTTLMSQLSGSDDVVIGVPLAGRTSAATHGLIGFFANTLPLRVDLAGARTFHEALDRHRGPVHELLTRQHVPFAGLVDALAPPRRANRNPYYDVCFQYLPATVGAAAFDDLEVGFLDCDRRAAQFDLSCDVHEEGDHLVVQFEYSTELFEEKTVVAYLDQYATLLRNAVGSPDTVAPSAAPVAVDAIRSDSMVAGGLAGVVAAQAARRPAAPAVRSAGRSLTFAELDQAAEAFAGQLRARGVAAGDRVGVLLEPSVDLAVAMLATARLGAVYVPGDIRTPAARTAETFLQAGCRLVVRDAASEVADDVAEQTGMVVLTVGAGRTDACADPVGVPELDGSEPAYVIFTSGSTGRPKGVVVSHLATLSLAAAAAEVYELTEDDVVLQMASPAVDVSIEELLASWHSGAEVFIHGPLVADPGDLARQRGLTVLNLPAPLWHEWCRQISSGESIVPAGVRLVVAGSDRVDAQRVRQWRSGPGRRVRLLNAYGVTEAAVSSAWYDTAELDADAVHTAHVPIGRPFPHAELHVLDADGAPVPDGVPGELWIGGPGVAIGYLDDPETTAARFRDDPFRPGRMYRTGDMVRRLPSGALDFRGRRDTQVKIRGTRIELAEVERVLAEVPGVAQSCVDVRLDAHGVPRLIGYLRPETGRAAAAAVSHGRVEEWRQIHDADVFNEVTDEQRADLNISGWVSSYTGAQIDADAMAEWRDEFVTRLFDERPGRVLEIGCGTGMILLPVAAQADRYVGTDISRRALDYVAAQLPAHGLVDRVRLVEAAAHEWDVLGDDLFDLIVLNSVVQYFPSQQYLAEVIAAAWSRLRPGGRIVLGDVRDLGLIRALHLSIARRRQPDQDDPAELLHAVAENVETENELCLAPGWFADTAKGLPDVASVAAYAKLGRADTEMNGFRYDVVLRRAVPGEAVNVPAVPAPAHVGQLDTAALDGLLDRAEPGSPIRLILPDPRVASSQTLLAALAELGCHSVVSAERVTLAPGGTVHPADVAAAAASRRLSVIVGHSSAGLLDVLVGAEHGAVAAITSEPAPLANNPLHAAVRRDLVAAARDHLGAQLPKAMVPSWLVFVTDFPQLASGKVDRSRLPDPPRATTASTGARPVTALEKAIAACWEQVLGVENLTSEDNFFEIGGDSISWLQIMSRCARHGIRLSARDIFDNQTVGTLASCVEQRQDEPEKEPNGGTTEAPLAPIQQWFVTSFSDGLDRQNQVQWYDLPDGCSTEVLRQAVHDVVRHHGVLAAVDYVRDAGPDDTEHWMQRLRPVPAAEFLPVSEVILPSYGPRQDELLCRADQTAQTGLSVTEGPLFRFVVYRTPPGEPDFAQWCIHHLAVDAVSWQFLGEDLATAVAARRQGWAPELPPRTASVLDWSAWSRRAVEHIPADEVEYWQTVAAEPALELPVRHSEATGRYGGAHVPTRRLSVPVVSQLSGELVTAAVLAAVRDALAPLTGRDSGSVWLEFHGRPLDGVGPDVTRTVGWFTALFPFVLGAEDTSRIRARLAGVPGGGVGYGRLRHLANAPLDTAANVVVNCLTVGSGREDQAEGLRSRSAPAVAGPCVDPAATMPFAVELNVVHDPTGSVALDCTVNDRYLDSAAADELANRLGGLIVDVFTRLSADPQQAGAFALLGGDLRGSSGFADLLRRHDIEAAYPLVPMQQLMLNRHLLATAGDANYNYSVLTFDGELDPDRFRAAWRLVSDRHEVLRTSVEWSGLPTPVQVVHRSVPDPVRFVDWSELSEARIQRRLTALLSDEWASPPALSGAPPFRFVLVRTAPDEHRLLWIDHHILLDGWSSAILIEELLAAYADPAGFAARPAAVPYRKYAEWLDGRPAGLAQTYWRDRLVDFRRPTDLPFDAAPALSAATAQEYEDLDVTLPAGLVRAIERTARHCRTTAGNVIAAAWAAFLHRYTGDTRVSFGMALSGRPAQLGEVTDMVGLYLTTLPQVVDVAADVSVAGLVDAVSREAWKLADVTATSSLWDVYRWAGVPAGRTLFHSVLVVQNFGAATGESGPHERPLEVRTERSRLVTGAALTVAVDPASGALRLVWDTRAFSRSTAEHLSVEFVGLVGRLTGDLDLPVSALPAPHFTRQPVAPERRTDRADQIFLPPQGPTEKRIAAIWQEELGIERIGRDLSLFEAGANSMTVIHLHRLLCQDFAAEVPLPAFFQHPTVQAMASLFDMGHVSAVPDERRQSRVQSRRAALSVSGSARRAGRPTRSRRPESR
ncbi:non-ribosomal peptide synthetase [Streptomyces chartreusis]|uniref:non-ribosomal peptide synthetase n=1 Tax=Streptomyces chartreusis TaxID=1969 RepID=UPI0036830E04